MEHREEEDDAKAKSTRRKRSKKTNHPRQHGKKSTTGPSIGTGGSSSSSLGSSEGKTKSVASSLNPPPSKRIKVVGEEPVEGEHDSPSLPPIRNVVHSALLPNQASATKRNRLLDVFARRNSGGTQPGASFHLPPQQGVPSTAAQSGVNPAANHSEASYAASGLGGGVSDRLLLESTERIVSEARRSAIAALTQGVTANPYAPSLASLLPAGQQLPGTTNAASNQGLVDALRAQVVDLGARQLLAQQSAVASSTTPTAPLLPGTLALSL